MIRNVLLIPTLNIDVAKRCLESFHPSLSITSTVAIIIYNGKDSNVLSNYSDENEIVIGYSDSERVANIFASAVDCSTEFLFGKQDYERCYGGASNLLLAVGCATGASAIAKIDDDCLETNSLKNSWMENSLDWLQKMGGVVYGGYSESEPNYLELLPAETARGILGYCYSNEEFSKRLSKAGNVDIIKNGNLMMSHEAVIHSCYPILFEHISQTRVRGEVYFWKNRLLQKGFQFTYIDKLILTHQPLQRYLYDWLRSIIVGYDLSLVFRTYNSTGNYLSNAQRRQAIMKFRDWINSALWPEQADFTKADLLGLLKDDLLLPFTDKVFSEMPLQLAKWSMLMNNFNLRKMIGNILPI